MQAFDSLGDRLTKIFVAEQQPYILADDLPRVRAAERQPRSTTLLLPVFDPYLLGVTDKDELVPPERNKEVFRNAGWVSAVAIRSGRVCGTWDVKRRVATTEVSLRLFQGCADPEELLRGAGWLEDYYGLPLIQTIR